MIKNGEISLIVNTTEGKQAIQESHSIRGEAVRSNVTYYTTLGAALATCSGAGAPGRQRSEPAAGPSRRGCSMNKVPMTVRGAELLREELARLKSEDRPQVIQAIAEARAHGDLKENAEYHAAKEQQGFIEGRIKEIEGKLSHIQVIDVTEIDAKGKVVFGATVELLDVQSDSETTYRIVGEDEADINSGLISYTSPIARALIGKEEGEEVTFSAPGGDKHYEIIEVKYI